MLERSEIEAVLTLAEDLHFRRTAERMRVTPTRVSQLIRTVERRLGTSLFERTSRRVELTPAGRQLVDEVRPLWEGITEAVQRSVRVGRGVSGRLLVGFVGPAAGQLVVGTSEVFRKRWPDCEVRLRDTPVTDVRQWLQDGEIEVALTLLSPDEPDVGHGPVLVSERQLIAVPAAHPLARRDNVSTGDLAGAEVVRLGADDASDGPSGATFAEALTLVGAGLGVLPVGAHASRYFARPDVAYVPLRDAPPQQWGMTWWPARDNARVRAFVQSASDLVREAR